MKKLFVLSIIMTISWSASAQDERFFIYLCFGQTNMVGHAPLSEKGGDGGEGFYSISTINGSEDWKLGTWRAATPPLCGPDSGGSLVESFGSTMLHNLPGNYKVGVVYVAVDNAEIDLFDKKMCKKYMEEAQDSTMMAQVAAYGGNPYRRMVRMAHKAKKDGVIRGILMHHGETDHCDETWLQSVQKIHGDLMHDLSLNPKDVPFIIGETVDEEHGGRYAKNNATIHKLSSLLPNTFVVSSKCCEAAPDKVHFTSTGYQTLGVRYAIKMLRGMKMGFEDSADFQMDCDQITHSLGRVKPIDVDGSVDKNAVFHFTSNMPMTKVQLMRLSGETFKTIELHGATSASIDLTVFPNDQDPFMEIFGENGSSVEIGLTP